MTKENYDKIRSLFQACLESDRFEIPLLPEVATKVIQITNDPDSNANALVNVIQSDQTLASQVMRIANSATYSPNCSIISLQQAITRLGMQTISEIALAASINAELFAAEGFESHIDYELKFSLATGLWAKEVARHSRKNVEAAFLSGLLHNIGQPIAIQGVCKLAKKQHLTLNNEEVEALEKEFQRAIGVRAVTAWGMPDTVNHVISYFDDYEESHRQQPLTLVVVAAATLASFFLCEDDRRACFDRRTLLDHPAFKLLNFYEDEVNTLLKLEEKIRQTIESFR